MGMMHEDTQRCQAQVPRETGRRIELTPLYR